MSLITTIADLKKYIHIDDNAKIGTFQKFINEAEDQFIVDLLGQEFYDEFSQKYASSILTVNPVPLSSDNAKLLTYIQKPIAYYAQFLSIDQIGVTFGELGIREHVGEDSRPADRVKTEKLQLQTLKKGDLYADKLLEFLEKNATDTNDYATWFESRSNLKSQGLIVRSTAIAMQHIQISNSRRIFLKLLPKIKEVEKRYVPQLVGVDYYNQLTSWIINDTVNNEDKELIDLLEPIIAKRALYLALPFMAVSIEADGLWLFSEVNQLRDRWFLADDDAEDEYRCHLKDDQFGFIADERKLRAFILENIDSYPAIKASSIYTVQPVPGPTFVPKNDPWNKHFIS